MLSVTRILIAIRSKRPTIFTLTTHPIQRLAGRGANFQHNILFLSGLLTSKTSIIIHIVYDKSCHCLEDAVHRSRKKAINFLFIYPLNEPNPNLNKTNFYSAL
jgi:hypothetical protein